MDLRPTDDLVRIAAAGGGFRLEVGLRPIDDLVRIAAAARNHHARLVFASVGLMSTDDLVRIAAAGDGAVVFEE